jgi:hypothetical protein
MLFGFVHLDHEFHTGGVLWGFLSSVYCLVAILRTGQDLQQCLLDILCVCFVLAATCVKVQFL